jgi:hypothetical protein
MSLRLHAAEIRLRRSPLSVCVMFFADEVGKKHHTDNCFRGRSPHAPCSQQGLFEKYCGGGLREREGTRFPHTPYYGGVWCFFHEVEKTPDPTVKLWHAAACIFAVRKQHTKQVTPVEYTQWEKNPHNLLRKDLISRLVQATYFFKPMLHWLEAIWIDSEEPHDQHGNH